MIQPNFNPWVEDGIATLTTVQCMMTHEMQLLWLRMIFYFWELFNLYGVMPYWTFAYTLTGGNKPGIYPKMFWKRWTRDYLPTLEYRQKWLFPQRNFKIGAVVLVTTDSGFKCDWPLGRISAIYPSAYGLVRIVDVITSKGKVHRDVRKVFVRRLWWW